MKVFKSARQRPPYTLAAFRLVAGLSVGLAVIACSSTGNEAASTAPVQPSTAPNPTVQAPTEEVTLNASAAGSSSLSTVEQNIIAEHNRVRQNPQSYIPILEAYLASMNAEGNIPGGCGPNCTMLTQEGKPAVEEAIRFLRNQASVGALAFSEGATQAAKSHAADQRGGATGHSSSDGSSFADRLNRFGIQNVAMAENIAYGPSTAQDVVMGLIVDDGVASRGHRTNIFAPQWTVAGVGCGDHATYGVVCVINYASQ
ncbi:MAG: CAP domain-containing protein [Cyanobacteria bacterium J06632_3]